MNTRCPNPQCFDGVVDTGGFTPWGAPIDGQCSICAGTGFVDNQTPNQFACLPEGVELTQDRGVYLISSMSRRNVRHRVDVEQMVCECESYVKGQSYQLRQKFGLCWRSFCPHLKTAAAAHGIICAFAFKQKDETP
jgi:hypothetical protein